MHHPHIPAADRDKLVTSTVAVFADIILPVAAPGTFTYAVPAELGPALAAGQRVVVNFGTGRKLYSGLVRRVHDKDPGMSRIKSVLSALDVAPVVTARQLDLWERIAEHYLCTLGEVMLAAMPAALVLTSATKLVAGHARPEQWTGDARQDLLLDALEQRHELTLDDAGALLGIRDPMPAVKRLMEQGLVMVAEELAPVYAPRSIRYVGLATGAGTEEALHTWFSRLEKAPRSLALLMRFVEMSRCLTDRPQEVVREQLLRSSGTTSAQLNRLVEKGLLVIEERPEGTPAHDGAGRKGVELSPAQMKALEEVRSAFVEKNTTLLHGVTASGKTELYMELIAEALEREQQVLYLLPEIALTAQVIARLRARFGERVGVFHSRLSPRERTDLWMRMLEHPEAHPVIVGARSALLLPFQALGLVVVDEEHDPSFKQHDPAPRYNARDMAVVLAGIHGGRTLLGSATPSLETMHNAYSGKYGHVELLSRHRDAPLPTVEQVDIADAQRRKRMNGHFSTVLIEAIQAAVERKEQVILFQNRRGYVPVWQCGTCGWIPECDHCDVSLTYHKKDHGLRCHYCGRDYRPPKQCASCGSDRLQMLGFGTEKIEEELLGILPDLRVARMDQDTTRGKHAFERLLARFGEGELDVLVGTQMVTKGLDFGRVTVVGILNADQLLRYPDLRAHERAFQLMAQVAGRSGRGQAVGRVLIQAKDVHHPIIGLVMAHDPVGMYKRELPLRQAHGYPPFTRLVRVTLKHRDEERVKSTSQVLVDALRPRLGERVLGPEPPLVARVRDLHLRDILLKLDRNGYRQEKLHVSDIIDRLFVEERHRAVRVVVDVDPV
jgi:primosomal protein N' (replication factor Y)